MELETLQSNLAEIFPGLEIENLLVSGQRVVYFAHFNSPAPAKHQDWGKVVLKVAKNLHWKSLTRLQKEIDILQSLDSKYYPELLHDAAFTHLPGSEDPLSSPLYITIEERVDATPLNKCMNLFSTEAESLKLITHLVDALSCLWTRKEKLVHRDLKPDNILIRANQRPVVIDLGLLREEGSLGITSDNRIIGPGTIPYASPEQIRNEKHSISFRSDLFSLGVITYQLLSGKHPFWTEGDFAEDVIDKILTFTPTSLDECCAVSTEFSELVEKLLSKEPYQRFRTVDSLKNKLEEFSQGD